MTPPVAVAYRWLDGWTATDEEWDRIETIIETRGWIPLNRRTTRVLLAETAAGGLVGFIVLQLIPHVEPLFVAPSMRATGVAEDLAERMKAYLDEVGVRGYIATAENPSAAKLCEAHGMTKVEKPVYVSIH